MAKIQTKHRLITTYELTDPTTLDDLLLCLAATIEDSLLKAGATPIKDYSIIDLFEYAKPFCLSIYNDKKKNITYTVGWPY